MKPDFESSQKVTVKYVLLNDIAVKITRELETLSAEEQQ